MKILDVTHFLRQIFFPNWKEPEDNRGAEYRTSLLVRLLGTKNGVSILFSIVLHCFLLAVLSLMFVPVIGNVVGIDILGGFSVQQPDASGELQVASGENTDTKTESQQLPVAKKTDNGTSAPVESVPQHSDGTSTAAVETQSLPRTAHGGFGSGGGFGNRNGAGRQAGLANGDCSQDGEKAVEAALEWLAAHQLPDGGWSLYFADSCQQCENSGTSNLPRRTAATALAILPFLGAGYTHQSGQYRKTVERGLLYLIKDPNNGIDGVVLQNDKLRMYSHGLAAIALCEAYALSQPQRPESFLGQAAQRAVLTIETAQDPAGGGWRYRPNQSPGDTSVFAWQLMALKSGRLGGLQVSQSVLYGAYDFLESVSLEGGQRYNYLPDGGWDSVRGNDSPHTCTAIGLLMRMYLGWKPGDAALDGGMERLSKTVQRSGHLRKNLYFSYYAALAFHHYDSEHWQHWNQTQNRFLVQTQSHQGHEAGSWFFPDAYSNSGGRLLNTALGAMILETPYRIMPLYRNGAER